MRRLPGGGGRRPGGWPCRPGRVMPGIIQRPGGQHVPLARCGSWQRVWVTCRAVALILDRVRAGRRLATARCLWFPPRAGTWLARSAHPHMQTPASWLSGLEADSRPEALVVDYCLQSGNVPGIGRLAGAGQGHAGPYSPCTGGLVHVDVAGLVQDPDVLGQDRVSDSKGLSHCREVSGVDRGQYRADLEPVGRVHDLIETGCSTHQLACRRTRSSLSVQRPNTTVRGTARIPAARKAPCISRSSPSQHAAAISAVRARTWVA